MGNLRAVMKPRAIKQLFSRSAEQFWFIAAHQVSAESYVKHCTLICLQKHCTIPTNTTEHLRSCYFAITFVRTFVGRYGSVESVRLRSVPVQPEAVALPRRAAVLTGKVDSERATAHAYVVFAAPEQAQAALAHNMQVVRRACLSMLPTGKLYFPELVFPICVRVQVLFYGCERHCMTIVVC